MSGAQRELVVLQDGHNHLYAIPQADLDGYLVPPQEEAEIKQRLAEQADVQGFAYDVKSKDLSGGSWTITPLARARR